MKTSHALSLAMKRFASPLSRRSAGWQPAVSPTGSRRTLLTLAATADCQSTTRQTASLRYVFSLAIVALLFTSGTTFASPDANAAVAAKIFLETYNRTYQTLYTVASEAAWSAVTDVTDEHTGERIGAEKAQAAYLGSPWIIEQARALLQHTNQLDPLTIRQLQRLLLSAAGSPGTIPEVVNARVTAEGRQSATLNGFEFKWTPPGDTKVEPLTANKIDGILNSSTNLDERLAVWQASKESGVALQAGLLNLRDLRNQVAKEMGFSSYFGLRAAFSDMTVAEMKKLTDGLVQDTRPLYEQLHCWAKYKLAERFGQPVPKLIPAHWIGNRWGQEWPGLVDSVDLDPLFKDKSPEWIVQRAVNYGESIGLPPVPANFWAKSDLYELPANSKRKKNTHASAWHLDLQNDVRSLMNVKSDASWFNTSHHELGHVFYDLSYSRPEVPFVLRDGASPAMHEAMAEALATAPAQLPYLRQLGLIKPDQKFDEIQWLLNDALDKVVFIPWSAGVMASWERDFYEGNLPADQLNQRWWEYVAKFQGIAPPTSRGKEFCDAATKTHINDDPAEYYKYSIAFAIKYQLHMHIAKKILHQDPRNCDVAGHKEVGAFLYNIMKQGATKDWRTVIREATGEEFSGRPMLEYFEPLTKYLKEQNRGREVGWRGFMPAGSN